jgi:hypothetical protein
VKALKQPSSASSESRRIEAMKSEVKRTAKPRSSHQQMWSASCARYEAFMQELAADYQRLISVGIE